MQTYRNITLYPIEPVYLKHVSQKRSIHDILYEFIEGEVVDRYLNGEAITIVFDLSSFLFYIRSLDCVVRFSFVCYHPVDAFLCACVRYFDAFWIVDCSHAKYWNWEIEIPTGKWQIPSYEVISPRKTYYSTIRIVQTENTVVNAICMAEHWPPSKPLYNNKYGRIMHEHVLYENGCITYVDNPAASFLPYYQNGPSPTRPSCLDVWRNILEAKYFNRWRKSVRVKKAARFRDINLSIMWEPNGPISKINEYSRLLVSHQDTLREAIKAGWK